ncbi:dinuclear metal center protein, YbgI/SA1388 family [Cephaloticoccus capnophilus]|uniref:Dinuclear metal center protein, YbgI/SA1388 family n=1 Tax=Cephaloticoccus capnophilus TaxID=1548208 RepID=A0A139SHN1_9BACT|nr:Nif3-like dinuclear metal center hexameric protein [Cephaloticoccus capnophilus]KXU33990.1 dinuclear metal center protein, YbgI/SA1388 family [Cephaloticoccus capnophilus]
MPTTAELVAYCDQRTRRTAFVDAPAAHNGLQMDNSGKVTRIGAAVDAGLIPFQKAAAAGIDFLIVHHGMYWDMPRPIVGPVYERVATLLRADCALYSSHLPLDAHPEIGNNALIARQLGLGPERGFAPNPGGDIGLICRNTLTRDALEARLREHYRQVTAICYGAEAPREVALCSGSGNSALRELVGHDGRAIVDTLITGELREEHFNLAQEARLNLYLCGHYATEVHGVRALAAELANRFELPWEFIETENPL